MREAAMNESNMKDDPLTRIQREIIEVTERENEFRKGHPTLARNMSESAIQIEHKSNGHVNGNTQNNSPPKPVQRAVSTSQLTSTPSPNSNGNLINGFSRKYTPNSGQKGIMQRFIASKGKLTISPLNTPITMASVSQPVYIPPPTLSPQAAFKLPDGKPIRKGFVPVEEKIQKELKDLKDRESELKKMRKRVNSYQLDFSSLDLSDKEECSDSDDDDDIPAPGKLRVAKSIGELYEALGEGRSPSPQLTSGPDSYGSLKPAKSLAQLCDLGPDEEALAPSSTKLIAKWESLIQKKQESGAA